MKKVTAVTIVTGALLSAHCAFAGTWQVTVTPTNSSPTPTCDAGVTAVASSKQTTALCSVAASGTSGSGIGGSATASYSGTWTYTWLPDNSTDWPAAYKVTSVATRIFSASLQSAAGTVSVDSDTITLPGSPTACCTGAPVITKTVDTSNPNLSITTIDSAMSQFDQAVSNGWTSQKQDVTIVTRQYTAGYFTANFTAPASIVLTFSASGGGATASLSSYTSSGASGLASAHMFSSDVFTAQ